MRSAPRLGPGREFDLLRRVFARAGSVVSPWVEVGPGDDAAVLAAGDAYLVVSTDLAVEGVHFRLEWVSEGEAFVRATLAALSDVAAMAAEPVGVCLSAAAPAAAEPERLADALVRAADAAAQHGAALLGGDLARGGDAWALDVVAVGRARRPVLRSGARPGDTLWVTGVLGGAALAVREWSRGTAPSAGARARFATPVPRFGAARSLAERGLASAMIDLSDGLVADAGHLAAASGVGIEIDAEGVPVFPGADATDALAGGEDYELLFSAPAGSVERRRDEVESVAGTPLCRIGRIVVGEGVRLFEGGRPRALASAGYDHFRER